MAADKSCPVVLRARETLEILAFEHPLAGLQLVKGSVEPGESTALAAVRELMEEAGCGAHDVRVLRTLALSPSYMTHPAHIVLARDLYPQRLEGDEPEPLEVIAWPIADLGELVMRDEMSDGRAMAALYIAREWLARQA